jgi:hypothetical protein
MVKSPTNHSSWPAAFAALASGIALPAAEVLSQEIPFSEARLYFELNNTDGDLGIHAAIDGGPWKWLGIEDTRERTMLSITGGGRLRQQGLTQLSFESAEPPFDELDPEVFFRRFPEGMYEIEGITLDGEEMGSSVRISHVLPAPAGNLRINGQAAAEDCDAANVPIVSAPVVITWDPVTESHPELGTTGVAVTVNRYQVFAEQRVSGGMKFSLDLPPSQTSYMVAPELIALGDSEYKFEVQVRADNGNQTAVENCFKVRR